MQTLTELFLAFLKIGLFTFGGGYVMIPFLQAETTSRGWLTLSEFTDIVAISQITPGPVAVNIATFVGYSQGLLPGALLATLGVCLPSFTIMAVLARFFIKFGEATFVRRVFFGLRPAVAGLIISAVFFIARLEFMPSGPVSIGNDGIRSALLAAACFAAMFKFKVSPFVCIIFAAAAGIVLF